MLGLSLSSTVRKLRNEIAAARECYAAEISAKDLALESLSKLSDVRLDQVNSLQRQLDTSLHDISERDGKIRAMNGEISLAEKKCKQLASKCDALDCEAHNLRNRSYITSEYIECLSAIFSDDKRPIFISGPAGTGKSSLIRYAREMFAHAHPSRAFQVVAPTGIAAENIGGRTIHSFFKFPPVYLPQTGYDTNDKTAEQDVAIIRKTDILVVDEASMVAPDLVDAIDKALRYLNGKADSLFGGVKVVFVGDLGQLPPVNASNTVSNLERYGKASPYFFDAKSLDGGLMLNGCIHRLTTIFRQSEEHFINALLEVRKGPKFVSEGSAALLASRYIKEPPPPQMRTTLCATNAQADALNDEGLAALSGQQYDYEMIVQGRVGRTQISQSKFVEKLSLKPGARVMLLVNSLPVYCNGTIGEVTALDDNIVNVRIDSGKVVSVHRTTIELKHNILGADGNVISETVGAIMQFPMKLAWGLTIHKGQGQTLDDVYVDLSRGFATGQAYTAFSRVRHISGLHLLVPFDVGQIISDPDVADWL